MKEWESKFNILQSASSQKHLFENISPETGFISNLWCPLLNPSQSAAFKHGDISETSTQSLPL